MATQAAIRQRVYDYLYGVFPTEAPFVTRLSASYAGGATSITVLDDTNFEINDVVENSETGEQFKVVAKPGADVLTVIPGWNGTTEAASVGTDDVLFKNPRFTREKVDNAIDTSLQELERWGVHVFGKGTITRANPKFFYELSETDIVDHMGVLRVYEVSDNEELPLTLPFRYQYNLGTDPTEYSQGRGVHIGAWGNIGNGEDAYFVYAQKIDNVTDLLPRQEELAVVGAVVVLLGGTIIPATHDPGARTDRTVQPGQTSRDVRHFQGRFISECRIEAAQLSVERQRMLREQPQFARARRWVS